MKPNISNSLIKAINKVDIGEFCPKLFEAMYISKIYTPTPSEAMKGGQYLEYILTGATLRDGSIPVADTTKSGSLTAQYKYIEQHKATWENLIKMYNISEIETSETLEYVYNGNNIKGILDVKCKMNGKPTIIDVKCTGKIDDKWSEFGWENIENKQNLTSQAVLYIYLFYKKYGIVPDFYFAVFSSTAKPLAKFIKISPVYNIEDIIESVEKSIDFSIATLKYYNEIGFKSSNKFYHCVDCEYKECTERLKCPEIQNVELVNIKL